MKTIPLRNATKTNPLNHEVAIAVVALVQLCLSYAAISRNEFNAAVQSAGSPAPAGDIYPPFASATNDFSRNELAMLIAQLIHESNGFRNRVETICQTGDHCAGRYVHNIGLPGKSYYGRGFFQLTFGANYKRASQALGLGDKLLQNPELVASDTKIAVDVSVWYWKDLVRPVLVRRPLEFGVTTETITGPIECGHGWKQQAYSRYQTYLKVASVLNIKNKAIENGCYN